MPESKKAQANAGKRAESLIVAALFAAVAGSALPSYAENAVTHDRLVATDKEPANWLTHHKSFSAQRFSSLNQINAKNVRNLKVAWTYQLGGIEGGGIWPHGGLEGTPVVEDGFIYVTDGWGTVYKLDMHGGGPKLVWKMDPKTDKDWAGAVACCGVNNRGIALWDDTVISHTLDGRLLAIDKASGKLLWQNQIADPDKSETITAAPIVVKGLAITGVAGAEYGIRGWIAATDLKTHKEVWRTYTIPATGEKGSETWKNKDTSVTGGGSTWLTGSYDPKSDTLYWGTGNPGPDWDNAFRPGDNLYTDSVVALDPDTGKIKWHFQATPNDAMDYDSVEETVLVDAPFKGAQKQLALRADRNGFGYALDRNTGKFVWGTQFVKRLTWTKGLDPVSGKPVEYDPNKTVQQYNLTPGEHNPKALICPANTGGKNWPPTSYNPQLRYWYIPVIEGCNTVTWEKNDPKKSYARGDFFGLGGPSQTERVTGSVTAIDVTTGKIAAKLDTKYPLLGGMLSTPDLVFTGYPSGEVVALNAKTLQPLWKFNTGGGVNAPPMTFSVDGKQYIAILVGFGGAWPKWFIDGTPELKSTQPGSTLYVFAL
jgi:alcohol dehydrogenase (cytochrome c)